MKIRNISILVLVMNKSQAISVSRLSRIPSNSSSVSWSLVWHVFETVHRGFLIFVYSKLLSKANAVSIFTILREVRHKGNAGTYSCWKEKNTGNIWQDIEEMAISISSYLFPFSKFSEHFHLFHNHICFNEYLPWLDS